MKAGAIGLVTNGELTDLAAAEDPDPFDAIERVPGTVREAAVEVEQTVQAHLDAAADDDPVEVFEGTAALVVSQDETTARIADDGVDVHEESVRETKYCQFVAVPAYEGAAHDGFIVVSRSAGAFAFDLIAGAQPGRCSIDETRLDLRTFAHDHRDDVYITEVGYSDDPTERRGERSGVTWADGSMTEDELDGLLGSEEVVTLDVSWVDDLTRVYLASSGWVEVYDPDWPTTKFTEFLEETILPVAWGVDADEETTQATLGGET